MNWADENSYMDDDMRRRIFAKTPWWKNVENLVLAVAILGVFIALGLTWIRADAKAEDKECRTLIWVGKVGTESRGVLRQTVSGIPVCEVKRNG